MPSRRRVPLSSANVVHLFVLDSDSSPSVRIVYPTAPKTVSVQQSQPLTLECIVSGSPPPAARWFKNGEEVTPASQQRRHNNNLAFVAVTRSDEGSYACAAETEQGTVTSANYTVNVLGKENTRMCCGGLFFVSTFPMVTPSSPPQSPCPSRRARPTSLSLVAPRLDLAAWQQETLPPTSPGCSTPTPSPHRGASRSLDPHLLFRM